MKDIRFPSFAKYCKEYWEKEVKYGYGKGA